MLVGPIHLSQNQEAQSLTEIESKKGTNWQCQTHHPFHPRKMITRMRDQWTQPAFQLADIGPERAHLQTMIKGVQSRYLKITPMSFGLVRPAASEGNVTE